MGATVVELEGVGKRYRLGEHHGAGMDMRETIASMVGRLRGRRAPQRRELWSLRDVSFAVEQGQALGIIGRNGAGKSTLLRIVSNITTPTEGRCRTRGRVGSLLEVGTGFHGELTGLENTFLNGAILGMSRREVAARLDDIVSFAGLDGFMDTPVKRYSSGMYLRLGFSIAAHMEAEILLVDEVLAVGDAEFQQRCLGKIHEVEQSGRTVLFVSHDLNAIRRLCPTSVWLDGGTVRAVGPTDDVVRAYLRSASDAAAPIGLRAQLEPADARCAAVSLLDTHGEVTSVLSVGERAAVSIDLEVVTRCPGLNVAVLVVNADGVVLLDESLLDATQVPDAGLGAGRHRLTWALPPILSVGEYRTNIWIGDAYSEGHIYEDVLEFRIDGQDDRRRVVRIPQAWRIEKLRDEHERSATEDRYR